MLLHVLQIGGGGFAAEAGSGRQQLGNIYGGLNGPDKLPSGFQQRFIVLNTNN